MGPVAAVLPVISGLMSVYSGYQSYKSSKDAAKKQEKIAALNAANIRAEGAEKERRAAREEAQRAGAARARMGASGFSPTGSMAMWNQAQQEEFAKQMGWLGQSTAGRAGAELLSGDVAASQTRSGGVQNLFGGLKSGVGDIYTGGQGMGWWS